MEKIARSAPALFGRRRQPAKPSPAPDPHPQVGASGDRSPPSSGAGSWHLDRALFARSGRELLYALADLPIAVAAFGYILAGLLLGAALVVVFIGLPLLAALLVSVRRWGASEAGRAGALLGLGLGRSVPLARAGGLRGRVRAALGDVEAWRSVAYFLVKTPLAAVVSTLAFACYGLGLLLFTYPVWFQLGASARYQDGAVRHQSVIVIGHVYLDTWSEALGSAAVGAVLLALAPWAVHLVLAADRWLARGLLCPTRTAERMRTLQEARDYAVDDSAAAVRRIERDLHDGAQARLVTLAMDLGLVKETLAEGDASSNEVRQARKLIAIAHDNAKKALVELRNLARGIHPPVLDSGLGAALASLADSSRIPVVGWMRARLATGWLSPWEPR